MADFGELTLKSYINTSMNKFSVIKQEFKVDSIINTNIEKNSFICTELNLKSCLNLEDHCSN